METTSRILITGAGGAAAVSFIKAFRGHRGLATFFAADVDPYAAGLYLVPHERRVLLPRGDDPSFADRLLTVCTALSVDVLVPTVDAELLPVAARRHRFEAAGVRVLLAPRPALQRCLDKWALFESLAAHVPMPRTARFDEAFDPAGWIFPLIVKPRRGSGSRGVVLVRDPDELAGCARRADLLVQAYLPGPEYSVDVLVTRAGEVVAAVPRERLKVDSGVAVTARTLRHPVLESRARQVARLVGLHYTANLQFRCDPAGEPHLLEINPRFPGTLPLTVASGVNMPVLCWKELHGLPVYAGDGAFEEVAVVRFWEEHYVSCAEVAALELAGGAWAACTGASSRAA